VISGSAPGSDHGAVAVVGVSCRFPGGGVRGFWELVSSGRSGVGRPPACREHVLGDDGPGHGGFVSDAEKFDAHFFAVSPRRAVAMDPRQRLVLETAWEALEDAGVVAGDLSPTVRALGGVFVGATGDDYAELAQQQAAIALPGGRGRGSAGHGLDSADLMAGLARGMIADRLSSWLGWRGPSRVVDCGWSSGLAAVWQAVRSLRCGESSLVLAGGVHLLLNPACTKALSGLGGLSPDGPCLVVDERANGYVRGAGVGLVVLKRLADAVADGDRIRAVIAGGAVGGDGGGAGDKDHSARAQGEVIARALVDARISASRVQYVELGSAGNQAGDLIEAAGLARVFAEGRRCG
jgi:acyl transferase domain-containing protein